MPPLPHLTPDLCGHARPVARVSEVAALLRIDESQIRRMVREGELEAHRHGIRGIRVYWDSVAAFQARRAVPAPLPAQERQRIKAQRQAVSRAAQAAADARLRAAGILP